MQLQYIGARYVPVWYHNSVDDSANWEINVEYEPLTWVTTQNNHLYLSKKTVPDNIGTPAQNTEYWLDMGSFNGSYQELEDEIDNIVDVLLPAIRQSITNLDTSLSGDIQDVINDSSIRKNKKIIIMGDSYNQSSDGTAGTVVTSVGDRIKANYPDRADEIVANWGIGGAGFAVKSGDYTFNEWIDLHHDDVSDPDEVTDLLLFGGYNEIMTTFQGTYDGGIAFCEKVKSYYPNCKVHLACVAWGTRSDAECIKINSAVIPAYDSIAMAADNAVFVDNAQFILHSYAVVGTDGVHPTDAGYDALALYLGSYIMNGCPVVPWGYMTNNALNFNSALGGGSLSIRCSKSNGITEVMTNTDVTKTGSFAFSNGLLTLGQVVRTGFIWGYDTGYGASIKIPVSCAIESGGNNDWYPCFLYIQNGYVYLYAPGFGNLTATRIYISRFSHSILTMYA